MKIRVKNLGALRQAEFELGDLTIICGGNNTGKTYATYALYGFLSYWWEGFRINVPNNKVHQLLNDGSAEIDIHPFLNDADGILSQCCAEYTRRLSTIFASSEKHFEQSEFHVDLILSDKQPSPRFERTMGSSKTQLFSILWNPNKQNIIISLLGEKGKLRVSSFAIRRIVGDAVKEIIFGNHIPHPFIASAERTGAAIFRKELNFARNRLLEQMSSMDKEMDAFDLLNRVYSDYALPVKRNVDFTRQLEDIAKKDSYIAKEHSDILSSFSAILGGEYTVTKQDELYFIPRGKRIKLTMDESSSSVRSLLDVGFYLRHVAEKGDLLIIDEPELNLHPDNQRLVTRLLARLVNIGIKVFITTHSDYIIKEFNTLIMLNNGNTRLQGIAKNEGFRAEELLSSEKVKVYIAEEALRRLDAGVRKSRCQTLTPADINPLLGIEARSFDKTIDDMNRIQEKIIWGGEENND